MDLHSSDDESAEMDRVRERLRQEPPRALWDESNLSSSQSSVSSVDSETRPLANSHTLPRFEVHANQSSKDKETSSDPQPFLNERRNLQGKATVAELENDTFSSSDRVPAAENQKRERSSFATTDPVHHNETTFNEYYSFLDDCEALDEIDRQIEASTKAKAETRPSSLLQLNNQERLLLDGEALNDLDRMVAAAPKTSLPSNDLQASHSRSRPVPCPTSKAKASDYQISDTSDSEIDIKRNPRMLSKRKRMDQSNCRATSKKKRKQGPRSTSQGGPPPIDQRQSEKMLARKKKASSLSKQTSTHPLLEDHTAESVSASHRDTTAGAEMTDASSEESFAFFDADEIKQIEERARCEQKKRTSLEAEDHPSVPSPSKAAMKPIEVDFNGDERPFPGSPSRQGNLDIGDASPPRNSTSNSRSDPDETYFDQAFGFQDVEQTEVHFSPEAYDGVEFSANAASSLEERQYDHDLSDFHSIETDERMSELDPKLYAPTPSEHKQPPIVHRFSLANRPLGTRRRVPVEQAFPRPVSLLWRTKFSAFNQMQSELANVIAYSDDNIVVSAPTGAGKTALFEMAMARFFSLNLQRQTRKLEEHQQVDKTQKIVYVSPSKALCDERYEDWSTRLASMNLGIQVALITGDGDPSASYKDLAQANLVLTTPEKWDSLTRRWTENFFLFASVKLFLVDEVHLVADDSRGWCLESIVCRMKTIQKAAQRIRVTQMELLHGSYSNTTPEAINAVMRTVAVSATLPNLEDIASLVEANEAHSFDDSYRPVPLTVHVIGQGYVGDSSANQFRFWSGLDRNIPELIHRFSKKKPSLVFCHSKADTEKLVELLAIERGIGFRSESSSNMAGQTKDTRLQKALFYGLAYHHAGLEAEDRRLVEKCFSEGKIRVLCATSTLAMGVNLPAHLVIIKGTKAWRGGGKGYSDLDQATLLQMIGRAGRAGFDTTGTAIIMTDNRSKSKFERLATEGLDPAVSKLCTKLDEVINAEVSQNVICSTQSAFNWIKTTLFSAQLLRQPALFGQGDTSSETSEEHLWRICIESLHRLEAIGALTTAGGQQVVALPASHVMSHNLVDYRAMERFVDIPLDATQCTILLSLSQIEGMHRPVRRSEKKVLKLMHVQLKHKLEGPPSKVTIQQPSEKVFVLLQASMMRLPIEDHTLRQEMSMIAEFSSRMLSALEEFSVRSARSGNVVLQSIRLRRALSTHCWAPNEGLLHQLAGVDPATAMNLRMAGISSYQDVMKRSIEEIEKAANRPPSFGGRLKNTVEEVLKGMLTMKVHFEGDLLPGATRKTVACVIDRQSKVPTNHSEGKMSAKGLSYTLIAYCDRPGGCILYRRNVASPGTYRAVIADGCKKVTFHLVASVTGLDETKELICHDRAPDDQYSIDCIVLSDECSQGGPTSKPSIRNPGREYRRPEVHSAKNKKIVLRQKNFPFVTPSPKPPSDNIESKKTSMDDRFEKSQPSCASFVGTAEGDSTSASLSLACQSSVRKQSILNDFSVRRDDFDSSFDTWDNTPFNGNALTGNEASNNRVFSPRITALRCQEKRTTIPSNGSQVAWKREKVQQHRTQQRAFVRKKDNPFSNFKCDPNDAENALDSLSSMLSPSSNQVIPAEGLKTLESAYCPYEGSESTTHRQSGFTLPARARRGAVLRNLPTNEFQRSQGLNSGAFTSYPSADMIKEGTGSQPYQIGQGTSRLNDSRYRQPRGNFNHFSSHQTNPYPGPAGEPQVHDPFYGSYRDPREYPGGHPTNAAIQNGFTEITDAYLPNLHEGMPGSMTAFQEFQGEQYHHGWE